MWDLDAGAELRRLALPAPLGHDDHVAGLKVVDGAGGPVAYAFAATSDATSDAVHAWDLRTGWLLRTARLRAEPRWPGARELSVVGGRPLVSAYDAQGRVTIWDAATGRTVSAFTVTPPPDFATLGLAGCRPVLFAARGLERVTRVLDPLNGRDRGAPVAVPVSKFAGTATAGGRTFAVVTGFGEGGFSEQVWELTAGRVIGSEPVEEQEEGGGPKMAAGDRHVATAGPGEQVLVWPLTWR
ncbi:hypothetical protein [Nonomuraea monospora]